MALVAGAVGGACLCGLSAWPLCRKKLKFSLLMNICKAVAKALPGIRVSMRNLNISTSRGVLTVDVHDLTIGNVEGFNSEFLAKFKELSLAIDISKTVKSAIGSRGKLSELEILLVKASGCHFVHDKDSLWGSNLTELLKKLGREEEADEKRKEAELQERKSPQDVIKSTSSFHLSAAKTTEGSGQQALIPWHKKEEPEPGDMQVLLREIDITGISIELATRSQKKSGTAGHKMKMADIKFDNFSTTCGHKTKIADINFDDFSTICGRAESTKVVRILLMQIMESVIQGCTNLAGAGHDSEELEEAEVETNESTWSYMTSWLTGGEEAFPASSWRRQCCTIVEGP